MKVSLSRRYHFSASHRLHADSYSDQRNREVFGKCNNPHGHGHNYVVQVTFGGQVDPVTGMICDLATLDAFARQNLLEVFDQHNLNTLPAFRAQVPSTENLAIEVFRIFAGFSGARLRRVRIEETGNNAFDYTGEGTNTR